MREGISLAVVRRLPRYYRFLRELMANDVTKISSKELGVRMGYSASQIRQDFNCFGGFGQQGYGYNVDYLYNEIGKILGVEKKYKAVIVGVGNLGHAIAGHINFEKRGFRLIGLFDIRQDIVGQEVGGKPVMHMDELEAFCRKNKPTVAVLTLPRDEAGAVAKQLIELGIKGLWNFSNGDLELESDEVIIENMHLGDSLMTLCYRITDSIE